MLPGLNGYALCGQLRENGDWTPILMLTAKDGDLDEAEALDTGAEHTRNAGGRDLRNVLTKVHGCPSC